MDIRQTTATQFQLIGGQVVLKVHELTDQGVVEHYFDVDCYALPLATNLLSTINEQRAKVDC